MEIIDSKYIKDIFERANIKQVRKFLLEGSIIDEDCYGTYQERIDRNSEDIIYTLKRLLKDSEDEENKFTEAMDDLTVAVLTYRDVFTEIGMQVGTKLLFQLLCE